MDLIFSLFREAPTRKLNYSIKLKNMHETVIDDDDNLE